MLIIAGKTRPSGLRAWRPPESPHFGVHIERLIGTMMGAVHLLPGTTQSSVATKSNYDAEAMATLTLSEFDRWFALEICRYNNSIHSSLGCTPVAKWEAPSGEMSGDIPFDMEAFRVSFLPSEQRQIRRAVGIRNVVLSGLVRGRLDAPMRAERTGGAVLRSATRPL